MVFICYFSYLIVVDACVGDIRELCPRLRDSIVTAKSTKVRGLSGVL